MIARPRHDDDSGVAAVVGAVLLLALLTTLYASILREDVPRAGAEAEAAWQGQVERALLLLATSAANDGGGAVSVPHAELADPISFPVLGLAATPAPASGALTLEPRCGSVNITHVVPAGTIVDVNDVPTACLRVAGQPVYGDAFEYRVEHGGVLLVEGDRAVVLAGPPLRLGIAGPNLTIDLQLAVIEGPADARGFASHPLLVDMAPTHVARDATTGPNARSAAITFESRHPAAWSAWLAWRAAEAGLPAASYGVLCEFASCGTGLDGLGNVTLQLHGGGASNVHDVAATFTMRHFAARVR